MFRNLFYEISCFLNSTKVGTDCYLFHFFKTYSFKGSPYHGRSNLVTELLYKGRGNGCIYRSITFQCQHCLENLAFIHNSTKRTTYKTHTTGHTLVIIDVSSAVFIRFNGIHATGSCTGTFLFNNCIVRACI